MKQARRYLKPAWARQHLEQAQPLLPHGTRVALLLNDKLLMALGEDGEKLTPNTPGVCALPLMLEGEMLGMLLLCLPTRQDAGLTEAWGNYLLHGLQGMIEANHARYSVASETLESYREMALLQRAVVELNHSLKPAAVAASLLKEFDDSKAAADYGAVFLRGAEAGKHTLIQSYGEHAASLFARLGTCPLFAHIAGSGQGDIINNLPVSPLWQNEAPEWQALLWLPLIAHGEHLGLLVLASRHLEGFTAADMKRAQTLVSVAATALRNAQLYAAEQTMFQSFVRVIATAIDAKSPYTAGHCRRVPEIALMLADKAHQADSGAFASFMLDEDGRNTLEIAAMLHDCGKVVTPEWIVDKATKLDSIINRIELVALRFEILHRDALIDRYRALAAGVDTAAAEQAYQERTRNLREDFSFIEKCNLGGEYISPEHVLRIKAIAAMKWRNASNEEDDLINENEVYNLLTQRGTLNPEEREIIENHAVHTIRMLSEIPFPHSLRNVVEYAAGHHERMDGNGYPRGLNGAQLSIPARVMAIADIFEALTAPDRPYRKGGSLSWAIDIMHRMKRDGHIDGELFDLFLTEGVYLAYAGKHLVAEQIDSVDVTRYLG